MPDATTHAINGGPVTDTDDDQLAIAAIERRGFNRGIRYMADLLEEAAVLAEAQKLSPDFVLALRNAVNAGHVLCGTAPRVPASD